MSLKWVLSPRYDFHCWASGKGKMQRSKWEQLIIDCDYTFLKAITNYGPKWKIWRWAIFSTMNVRRTLFWLHSLIIGGPHS